MCRVGTRAFLATGILLDFEMCHMYHHDVESFLYVMIWISMYGGGHTHQNDPLAGWQADSSRDCYDSKFHVMYNDGPWSDLLLKLRPGFVDCAPLTKLLEGWRDLLFVKMGELKPCVFSEMSALRLGYESIWGCRGVERRKKCGLGTLDGSPEDFGANLGNTGGSGR
jgi:hypothetical protein